MSDTNAARRYARALVSLAVDAGNEEQVHQDLRSFLDAMSQDGRELGAALRNPVFTTEERAAVLAVVLPRLGLSVTTTQFLRLLSERGRMDLIDDVVRFYTATMDDRAGRVRVRVSTVEPLTPQLEAEIRASFERSTGKQVLLEAKLDASLIGGMVARLGDRVYDASLRTRLEDLKHRLINAPVTPEA